MTSNVREAGSIPRAYLDWNATTPLHPEVVDAMRAALEDGWANPASVHADGRRALAIVEDAREAVAALCGVDPRDVVWTSGATEANNLALHEAPALVTSRLEHPSIVKVAEGLERRGRAVWWLPIPSSGRIDPEELARACEGQPAHFAVALMAANHETGVLQPVVDAAAIVTAAGGRLHVDAAQAAGKVPPVAFQAGHSLALAAHKIRGPKGIGALVLRAPGRPAPLLLGGAQERGLRPGTVDPVAAAGFGAAARRSLRDGPARYAALARLRDRLERELAGLARPNGGDSVRLPHVSNLSLECDRPEGTERFCRGDEVVAALDLLGVSVSSGSACSAGSAEPSPIIEAMLGRARALAAIRVSLGDDTSPADVDRAISSIIRVVRRHPSGP